MAVLRQQAHPHDLCKAHKRICRNCSKRGHFPSVCHQKNKPLAPQPTTLGYLSLHTAATTQDHLIGVAVQVSNANGELHWLPDGRADNSLSASDLALLDLDLHPNLAPDCHPVRMANGVEPD